jgi:molybdate transport system substrate-binding protein
VRRVLLTLAAALAGALLAGCGSDGEEPALTVLAASSLETALSEYDESAGVAAQASFAGSDQLAAQIRRGAPADVFASADTEYPAELHRDGLVEEPFVFAANELVLAVPPGSPVTSLADLARPGTKLIVGAPSVPVGRYTRALLARLPRGERRAIEANIRSEEPEVGSVVAKLEQGAADAGFVYATDAEAAGAGLATVKIPARLRPTIAYAAAVVSNSDAGAAAHRYLNGLLHGEGANDLRRAGFLPPP